MKWNAFLVFLTLQANRELVKAHITFCFIREWTLLAAKQHAKDPAQTLLRVSVAVEGNNPPPIEEEKATADLSLHHTGPRVDGPRDSYGDLHHLLLLQGPVPTSLESKSESASQRLSSPKELLPVMTLRLEDET